MTYQQILALLVAKFQGVRRDGLEHMARTLALQCTTEADAKVLIEKITDAQVTEFVKEYRRVVDKEVSEASKTLETNLKKKFGVKEEVVDPTSNDGGVESKTDDIATIVANAVAGAVQPLQDRLDKYEQGEVGRSRLQALQAKLSMCKDETFKALTLKDFGRMRFDDDQAFNEYLTDKEADIKTANQSLADAKLSHGAVAPMMAQKSEDGVSKAVADFVASQRPDANAFKGKEV